MFTKHRWNILNIQWHPVDDHYAIMTTLTRSSHANGLPFASLKRPPRYPDRDQSSCCKTGNRTLRNTTTIFYRYPYAGKLVTCQQQFTQLHHVVLKHRRYRDVGVSASAVSSDVTQQTHVVNSSGICTAVIDFVIL